MVDSPAVMDERLDTVMTLAADKAGTRWDGPLAERLDRLCEELLRWNERVRLVGYRSADDVFEHLILEALRLLAHLPESGRVLDVGSGAGFPGLVLAAARPALALTSIDAREKKIHFQRHAARLLGLSNFEPRAARLEPGAPEPDLAGAFDAVTAQALAPPGTLIPWLAPYLRAGGLLALLQGPGWERQREPAATLSARHGLRLESESEHRLPLSGARRLTIVFRKGP